MRLPVQKLRWILIAGAALLLTVLVAYVGYGRYKALKRWQEFVKRTGATLTHDTNGFTYSQSLKGKTVFTLHAAKASQHADGTWSLHDAELTLYSKTSQRADHIYGAEFEYDPQEGVAKAIGEVHMDLEAPQGFSGGEKVDAPRRIRGKEGRAPTTPVAADQNLQTIHVRTSGLVYIRSLGVAATKEDVEFTFGNVECHAHGAEFEQGESTVHLLAAVHMTGTLRGEPLDLTANKADLDRAGNVAALVMPVLKTAKRTVSAGNAVFHLRKDGSVEAAEANTDVTLVTGTQTLKAARLEATLSEQSQPKTTKLSGGVTLEDTSAVRPMHGHASEVDSVFDDAGQARTVTAMGDAVLLLADHAANKVSLERTIAADRVEMTLTHADGAHTARLTELHAMGHADVHGESALENVKTPGKRNTWVSGNDLRASFVAGAEGRAQVQRVVGRGHTRLSQSTTLGDEQTSTADTLELTFMPAAVGDKPGEMQIASAVHTGHVSMDTKAAPKNHQAAVVSTATAERAVYAGASQELTLSGHAELAQNGTEVAANTVVLNEATGNAQAQGQVTVTLDNANATAATKNTRSHVMAESGKFSHGAQLAEFTGTDAHPARLWQDASQVQAATLILDGQAKTLLARPAAATGTVSAVFASHGKAGGKEASKIVRVSSARMDYSDASHEAVFAGGVKMNAVEGEIRSQRTVVFLNAKTPKPAGNATLAAADPLTGSIDRAVASGAVHLNQVGRSGTGEQLLYTAATDSFVLTGTPSSPPRIVDAQQGSVTGTTLLFGAADSTIVVAGNPGEGKRGRVRTETDVKQ